MNMKGKNEIIVYPIKFGWFFLPITLTLTALISFAITEGAGLRGFPFLIFSLGTLILSIVDVLPHSSYLKLTKEELLLRIFYNERRVKWPAIEKFWVSSQPPRGYIRPITYKLKHASIKEKGRSVFNRAYDSPDGTIPGFFYRKIDADGLCSLLEEWRKRNS